MKLLTRTSIAAIVISITVADIFCQEPIAPLLGEGTPIIDSNLAFEKWDGNWQNNDEIKDWFGEFRAKVSSNESTTSISSEELKKQLSNVEGYIREPTPLESAEIISRLKDSNLDDYESYKWLGAYLSAEANSSYGPVWAPVTPGTPGMLATISKPGSGHAANSPRLDRLEEEIKNLKAVVASQNKFLKTLTEEFLKTQTEMEKANQELTTLKSKIGDHEVRIKKLEDNE